MKICMRVIGFVWLTFAAVSCAEDVDLFADLKDIPIVYGILDSNADTNFIKITRTLDPNENAFQNAINPELNNYPGKLDVRLTEYCNGDSIRQIILDTITLHNKQPGIFYAPEQKLYYTAETLGKNTTETLYSYRLTVVLPDRTLEAFTDMVGSDDFRVQSLGVNFSQEYFGVNQSFQYHPAINGFIYDFDLAFSFKERRTPESDSVFRIMKWHIATYYNKQLQEHSLNDMYYFNYRPENFWKNLEEFIGDDTCVPGLIRMISDQSAVVYISAGGNSLHEYLKCANIINEEHPIEYTYSNIKGGIGVFSSKMTCSKRVGLGGNTIPQLIGDPKWGFKFSGGSDP